MPITLASSRTRKQETGRSKRSSAFTPGTRCIILHILPACDRDWAGFNLNQVAEGMFYESDRIGHRDVQRDGNSYAVSIVGAWIWFRLLGRRQLDPFAVACCDRYRPHLCRRCRPFLYVWKGKNGMN